MRKVKFVNDEYYHIYNRGVDKRIIFECQEDLNRFFLSMEEFNTMNPIDSIYEAKRLRKKFSGSATELSKKKKLVNFVCYCLNPNHYHFILKQLVDKGIQKFMHRLGTGYTEYFNKKYKRSGSLCQGKYQAIHIGSNEYLLHLSTYINLNYKVHNLEKFSGSATELFKSSWDEYVESDSNKNNRNKKGFCEKDIILDQFGNAEAYKGFSKDSLKRIKENKRIKRFLLE